jgi:hypothetical protein
MGLMDYQDSRGLNLEALGLRLSKPQPRLYSVSLSEFQQGIDRISSELREHGYFAVEARLIPEWGHWLFYDVDGHILIRVDHWLVERVVAVYRLAHERELDAQIDALLKEPKREW